MLPKATTVAPPAATPPAKDPGGQDLEALREAYGIPRPTFAKMLGLSEQHCARREGEDAAADSAMRPRLDRVKEILESAAQVMRREYVATWIEKPNSACAELGARAPIDLMERGDYAALASLLFALGSGVGY